MTSATLQFDSLPFWSMAFTDDGTNLQVERALSGYLNRLLPTEPSLYRLLPGSL